MNLQIEIEKIEAQCLAEKTFRYLNNFRCDNRDAHPNVLSLLVPAYCRLYPHFTVAEGRMETLLSVLNDVLRADPTVDVSAAFKLVLADAEVPREGDRSDVPGTYLCYTPLVTLAGFVDRHIKDKALHDSLISKAIELSDSPWGKYAGLSLLLENSKINAAQAEKLVELAKKHLKKGELKVLLTIVERRKKYLEIV